MGNYDTVTLAVQMASPKKNEAVLPLTLVSELRDY